MLKRPCWAPVLTSLAPHTLPHGFARSPTWGGVCPPGSLRQGLAIGRAEVWKVPVPTGLLPTHEEVPSGRPPEEAEEP